MITRKWEIPRNASPSALLAWHQDIAAMARDVSVLGRGVPLSDTEVSEFSAKILREAESILGLEVHGDLVSVSYQGETRATCRVGLLVDAALWRLWHRIPGSRVEAADAPSAGIFARSLSCGAELADRLFPFPFDVNESSDEDAGA